MREGFGPGWTPPDGKHGDSLSDVSPAAAQNGRAAQ